MEAPACAGWPVWNPSGTGSCITGWNRCIKPAKIFTPVDNPKVIMRPLVSRREAEALIDRIPDLQPEAYYNKVLRELTEHYDTILKTYDCEALLKLTMSIYAKKQEAQGHKRRLGAVDESFLRRAEELLFSELAAALGLERDQVQPYIAAR